LEIVSSLFLYFSNNVSWVKIRGSQRSSKK